MYKKEYGISLYLLYKLMYLLIWYVHSLLIYGLNQTAVIFVYLLLCLWHVFKVSIPDGNKMLSFLCLKKLKL